MKNYKLLTSFILILVVFITACEKLMPSAPKPEEVMDAPLEGLSLEQNKVFNDGAEEFDEVYTAQTGLGPIFVASSCAGCHAGDNKGHPFTTLVRFGQSDTSGNQFLDQGAPQLQHNAIQGYIGEQIPNGATSTKLIAPIVSGLGFLELVSDNDIIALADPNDLNADGISGRVHWNNIPNWVKPFKTSLTQNGKFIGRFGRKAAVYNLHQQIVGAFNNDIGITTSYLPIDPINVKSGIHPSAKTDLDIDDKSLNATIFYIQALQTPFQRNQNDVAIIQGKTLFKQIGCEKCHTETLKTQASNVEALSNKTFHPYTDLLLHDMGEELNDHYTEGYALSSEWRTTPLWGVGLSKDAQGGEIYLMHDGRARSFEAAIQLHGGESAQSRNAYNQLSNDDQQKLIAFLQSL